MNKYLIYIGSDGQPHALEVRDEQKDKAMLLSAGKQLVREYPVVGTSEYDALDRVANATMLRAEGKEIGSPENIKRVQDQVQAKGEMQEDLSRQEQDRREREAYATEGGNSVDYARGLLKQAGRSVPKLVTSAYEAIVNQDPELGRAQTFADRYMLPYEGEMTQAIAGDPTLVPSMLIPGVGEAKIASIASKVAPALKTSKAGRYMLEPAVKGAKKAIDNTVQSAVVEAPDALEGRGSVADVAGGAMLGTGLGTGLELAGKAGKAVGKKIITSTIKPKVESSFDAEKLMEAVNPDGSNVVSGFSSVPQIFSQMDQGIKNWTEKQSEAIPEGKNNTLDLINSLRSKYKTELNSAQITPDKYQKKMAILDEQEQVLSKRADIGEDITPAEMDLREIPNYENAKKNDAAKFRYKLESGRINKLNQKTKSVELLPGEMTKEQRKMNAVYPYPKFYKQVPVNRYDLPEEPQMLDEWDIEEYVKTPEKRKPYINTPNRNIHNAKVSAGADAKFSIANQNSSDPTKREVYRDIYGGLSDILGGSLENPTPYREATQAMAPLMASRNEVNKAADRIDKLNIIPLTSAILAGQGLNSDDPRMGALGLLPMLTQGTRIGTGAYRLGQQLPKASRYAIPAMLRAVNNEE